MKIVLPGGSGQVGTMLARAFSIDGHEVVLLSRRSSTNPWRVVKWDGETPGEWMGEIDGADVVINLAGRNVNCRYNDRNRREIMNSRVNSTRVVGEAIANSRQPPQTWLQASTATIYAHRYDAPNDEAKGIIGGSELDAPANWRFSVEVARAWEHTAEQAKTQDTRKVILRTSLVMSPDRGGIFDVLLRLVRFGLGGKVGDGRQYVSWIHDKDFVRVIKWLIEHEEISGAINLTAPNPLPYVEFMRALRRAWGIPIGLPATRWMLEIGTFFLRTESELVLKSRRVIPGRLSAAGFEFQYPDWSEAARDLCQRYRDMRRR